MVEEHRCDRAADEALGHATEPQPLDPFSAVRDHDDQVCAHPLGLAFDRLGNLAIEDDVPDIEALATKSPGEVGKVGLRGLGVGFRIRHTNEV